MASVVKTVSKMYASVAVLLVICLEGSKNSKFNFTGVPILLNRANDLDGDVGAASSVISLNDFAKRALSQQTVDLIFTELALPRREDS